MKPYYFILLFFIVTSCNYFDVKKTSSEAILNDELKTFNWSEVDTYPTFESCDYAETKDQKKICFQNTLTGIITTHLQEQSIIVSQDINDTLQIQFQISEKGILSLLEVQIDSLVRHEIPNIENMLHNSLDSLPKIFPALKRGQQVKTEFKLPVIIQMN